MAINPKIKERAEKIRKEVYGKDVREALASGLEVMSEDVEGIKENQQEVQETFQNLLDETTGKDVISAPEILNARRDTKGKTHSNLKERLDTEYDELSSQLAETIYYDEITFEKHRDEISQTDYWLTYIPHKDSNGNLIELKHGFQNDEMDSGDGETARSFSNRHMNSFTANASTWNPSTRKLLGIQIQDGVIKKDEADTRYTLGWKADNTLVAYPPSVSAADIIADGCVNAVTGFFPIIENGKAVDPSVYSASGEPDKPHPRQVIAQLPNKDIIFLTCDGRRMDNRGMTYDDCIRILLSKGATFAYNLDGGGSAQTVVRGVMVNRPIDDNGLTERKVGDFIYVKKPSVNPDKLKAVDNVVGTLGKRITDLESQLYNLKNIYGGVLNIVSDPSFNFPGLVTTDGTRNITKLQLNKDSLGYYDYIGDSSIFHVSGVTGDIRTRKGILGTFLSTVKLGVAPDDIDESGIYWCTSNMVNAPSNDISWAILHIKVDAANKLQLAIPFHNTLHTLKLRRTTSGVWGPWRDLI